MKKILRVLNDLLLKFNLRLIEMIQKAKKKINKNKNENIMVQLFKTLVRPILE